MIREPTAELQGLFLLPLYMGPQDLSGHRALDQVLARIRPNVEHKVLAIDIKRQTKRETRTSLTMPYFHNSVSLPGPMAVCWGWPKLSCQMVSETRCSGDALPQSLAA